MKKIIFFLLATACLCNCSSKKETIEFITLNSNDLNEMPFKLPQNKIIDSVKEAHNRCMGVAFDANAALVGTKNLFFIGTIINKQSGAVITTIKDFELTTDQIFSQFSMVTTPCYNKRFFHLPLKSVLGEKFNVELTGGNEQMNKELNDAILNSDSAEIETGSWIYLDMKEALKKILDTVKTPAGLQYKKALLDTTNLVLIAEENIMSIRIVINTKKNVSPALQALLATGPSGELPNSAALKKPVCKLYYFNSTKFQITINGFFPIVGQFVKAVSK